MPSGACEKDMVTACTALPSGPTGDVQKPVLRQTLPASWDENWLASPAVADLDGDGHLELVISLKDTLGGEQGGVQIWDLPGSATNCVEWSTGRGGPLRQGRPGG